jgi:ribosomal protein S18 acetylase RimI-like enzyme
MDVAQAAAVDLDAVMLIVGLCVHQMRDRGSDQWDELYPTREILAGDIAAGNLWVLREARLHETNDTSAIIGAVVLNEAQPPEYAQLTWRGTKPLVIHRLCVHPDRQGSGAARQLMTFAESRAARHGYDSVRLDTYSGNPRAVALYEGRGYRISGYVRFRRRTLPFICFELPLQQGAVLSQ